MSLFCKKEIIEINEYPMTRAAKSQAPEGCLIFIGERISDGTQIFVPLPMNIKFISDYIS